MSWSADATDEIAVEFRRDAPCLEIEDAIARGIRETLARVRTEVAEASKGLPYDVRLALDLAIKNLGEP